MKRSRFISGGRRRWVPLLVAVGLVGSSIPAMASSTEVRRGLGAEPTGQAEVVVDLSESRVEATLTSGDNTISVTRRGAAVTSAVDTKDGLRYATRGPVDDVVAKVAGGVSLLTIIDSETAPTGFTYDFEGISQIVSTEAGDGSFLLLDAAGDAVATVASPWAHDAEGTAVPTHYEVSGTSLIQHVDHHGSVYPVTADPTVGFGWFIYVKFSKTEVKNLVNKYGGVYAGATTFTAGLCSLIPLSVLTNNLCRAVVVAFAGTYWSVFVAAKNANQCVQIGFNYAPPHIPGHISRYNC